MFERYTDKARRVIFFARYEASNLGGSYIESEHLLLGLLREDKVLVNRFLRSHAAVESIRRQIENNTPAREKTPTSVDLPLSQECRRALASGAEEAERLGHKTIATTHLLAGLLREDTSYAARLLHERGLDLESVREELARELGDPPAATTPDASGVEKRFSRGGRIFDMTQEMKNELLRQAQARGIETQALLQALIEKALYPPPVATKMGPEDATNTRETYQRLRERIEAEGSVNLYDEELRDEIARRKGMRR